MASKFKKAISTRGSSIVSKKDYPMIILFLLPAVFFVLVFAYYPAFRGVLMAFQKVKSYDLFNTTFVGLDNFKNLFKMSTYGIQWTNTIKWMIGCVGGEFILGFAMALVLRKSFKGKSLYEGVAFMPWALSGFMVGIMWRWMFNGSSGMINDVLMRLGLIERQIGFLSTPGLNLTSVMIAKVWTGVAFFTIVIGAVLRTIPKSLYEAADIDGAGKIRQFFNITLPSIRTVLLMTVLLRAIQTFGAPDLIFSMTKGGPAGTSHILTSYIMLELLEGSDYGKVAAAGIVLWIFILVCSVTYIVSTKALKAGDE